MDHRTYAPGYKPRRRLVSTCMFCRRFMFWRRERYCARCLRDACALAAEVFEESESMEYCNNCQSTYQRTPETEPKHLAPCTRCGSDGHAACQH